MVYAFVLVKTGVGTTSGVIDALADEAIIVEGHVVAGEFDVVLEVEAEEVYDILDFVSNTIQQLEGVHDTRTYVALG